MNIKCNSPKCDCPSSRNKYTFRYVNENKKFIYYSIPKAASTSLRYVFFEDDRTASLINPQSPIASYFKFSIVRNPWSRMISLWKEFTTREFRINQLLDSQINITKSTKFIDFIKITNEFDNHHWQSQLDFIPNDMDFIGKFESLQDDFNVICNKVQITNITLPHMWKTIHRDYKEYYNERAIQMVASKYAEDIEKFNYSF